MFGAGDVPAKAVRVRQSDAQTYKELSKIMNDNEHPSTVIRNLSIALNEHDTFSSILLGIKPIPAAAKENVSKKALSCGIPAECLTADDMIERRKKKAADYSAAIQRKLDMKSEREKEKVVALRRKEASKTAREAKKRQKRADVAAKSAKRAAKNAAKAPRKQMTLLKNVGDRRPSPLG